MAAAITTPRGGPALALARDVQLLALLFVSLSALWWTAQAVAIARAVRLLPRIADMPREARPAWPRLSLVVPARNEAAQLEAAVTARLAEGYPELELVLVDDRSDDDTGTIADRLAAADPRVLVEHVSALPNGWLGKVHAMHRGLARARGEWLLFSDADIHLAPGTLERVLAWAEREGVDHVAAIPSVSARGPLVAPALAGFFRLFTGLARLTAVSDPASKVAIGSGAFNLVRRSALVRTPGLEWLKMEIGDDVALGLLLKRSGARQAAVIGEGFITLEFYPSIKVMIRALEKNGATAPAPLLLAGVCALVVLELGFLAGLALDGLAAWLALFTLGLAIVTQAAVSRWLGLPRWPALVPGLSVLPLAWALARSTVLAWRRGGVMWRGTFYPTTTIRAGMRLGAAAKP